ncbi:tetratricopeptide repeat protein [Thermospira aquatica]|uniref:Tetratricopeptide repeat protein n=1 Tax=Thermospira aquatica TaxID=2828656 RepID=A0AAX3BB94_9SPIR|nr:hypothetical protein [Thermospira aquatica]URA09524.1 hypothetical protein KDW03_08500 [Thermospira aquatica]
MKWWKNVFLASVLVGCSRYYTFDRYYDEQNWQQAKEILENISEKNTDAYRLRLYRITFRLALAGDSQVLERLKLLLEKEDPRFRGYQEFGRLYLSFVNALQSGDFENVLGLKEPFSRFPEEFQPYAAQIFGIAHLMKNEAEEARKYLQKSYMMEPMQDTLYFLGQAHLMCGSEQDAVATWKQVIAAKPGGKLEAMSYFQLGELEYNKGNFSQALEWYFAAVNLYPESEIFVDKIAFCYQKMKNKKLSEKFRKIALRINQDYATAWFYLNFN